ncbi:MAG: hypothetical protein LBP99_03175, partial [Azoarcus sp.]|jgi:hypothetical protein|nr:hypothetical protein [Azoarcus sp.]
VTVERIEREKLADRMTIYRRGAEVVYSNELQHGQWAKTPQAREALEFERSREMTLHERREYVKGFETLAKLMARPERNASAQEFAYMENLQKQAKAGLAAEVFRREPIDQAVQQHPELAPAYASLRAIEAKVETDSAMRQHSNFIMARVRHNIAAHIERGEPIPGVEIREERQVSHDQQHNQQTR